MLKKIIQGLLLILTSFPIIAATLNSIQIKQNNQVVIQISGAYSFKYFLLTNPHRFVIDLQNVSKHKNFNLKKDSALIDKIRLGNKKNHTLRVVFEFKTPFQFTLLKNSQGILVTFNNKNHVALKHLRNVMVVLDPGHGGKDPGAIGPKGHKEKDVVLQIAKHLQRQINKEPGMQAILTREKDVYVSLRKRLEIARKNNADIFVSIHADAAYLNRDSTGASIFALSKRGATSEAARWLAAKENHSELGGVNFDNLQDDDVLVRRVLIDLSQTATNSFSVELGSKVLNALNKLTNLHHPDVEQARFVVLKSPDIPSILIETGFISNKIEEKNLTSKSYQLKLSKSITQGIKNYFLTFPPDGTLIESKVGKPRNLVKAEELPIFDYNMTIAMLMNFDVAH